MALANTLKVYLDTEKMMRLLFDYTDNFPKKDKYTLGEKIRNISLDMLSLISLANSETDKNNRIAKISLFLSNFTVLVSLIRLAVDRQNISTRQHTHLAPLIQAIEKGMYSWRKYTEK